MKNFTKENFKTNSLWIRLLIMAFMLLAGSSSVWAAIVYYVNKDNWEDVYIHYWGGSGGSDWNGNQKMGYTNSNILGFKIYSYEIGNNNSFIFKRYDGDSNNNKTGDITGYTEQKPYYYDGTWYTSVNDIINSISRYVAGVPAAVFGETWKENKVENKMTGNQNGLYSITYSSVSGSNVNAMSFKITDGSWSHAWPDNNYEVPDNYDTNKTYNVTITYKFSDNSINVTAEEVAVTYTITYKDQGGGTFSGTHETGYPTKHTYGTATTLKTATKDGYDFLGWFTSSDCSGTAVTTLDATTYTSNIILYAKWEEICYQSATEGEGLYSNGNITLSAEFNTCGNAFIGFQWKEKNSNWCYEDNSSNPCFIPLGQNNISNETVTTTVNKSGGTFVFRPYIVVGNNAQDWLYGDEFEVVTCSDPSAGYSISNENASVDWDGTEKEVIITTVNGYATPSKIYYEESETKPTAVGEYTITIDVPSNGTYCPATGLKIGTFEILCATATSANFTISNTTFTYNENKQTPTVTPNAGVGTATATYKQGDTTVESPTNAGTYDIYVTTEAGTGYCAIIDPMKIGNYTIDRKDVSKEDYTMSPVEFTYNGEKQVPIITPESGVGIVRSTEYKLNNTTVVENPTDAGTYTVYISSDAGTNYKAASSLELGTFTIAKKDPTKTDFSYVVAKDYTGSALSAEVNWIQNTGSGDINTYYKENGAADNTYTTEEPTAAGTYIVAVTTDADVNYAAATTKIELGEFVINCPSVAAPAITTPATVCAGTPVTLSNYNGVNINTVKWYSNLECTSEVTEQVTPTDGTKYYAKAYHEASGCYSSQYSTLTFTVNPLPTITISGSEKAVLYEDVTLTATATTGATVKWYEDGVKKGEGLTYVVTSETATSKTVTATATSAAGCTSVAATKIVTFGAEVCGTQEVIDDSKIEIWCKSSLSNLYLHLWYENGNNDGKITEWPGTTVTKDSEGYYKWTYTDLTSGKEIGYIFHVKDDDNNKTPDKTMEFEKGKRYKFTFNGGTNAATTYTPEDITKEILAITDPAVKTVSVETEPGEGNIIFEGQVVKTGCAETLTYGFAYSTDANADKSTWTKIQCTNVGNTVGTQFSGSKTELEDETYYVCAYITNSEGTTYGTVTEVSVSTVKTPISDVTLNYCDEYGKDIDDPNPMCKGATAYVKLSYVGSKYSDIKWLVEGVETDDVTDEGDGVWSYEVQGDGSLSVELKNDANTDPAWPYSNKLLFTIKPEPIAPTISLDKSTLCSNDDEGATISLGNTVVGQTYSLFKEIENDDDTQIGNDIECTEQNKGSISFNLKGLDVAGRYYVIAKENVCNRTIGTTSVTLEVVNTTGLSISIEPNTAVVTPWEPVKLKITHTEGYQYNVTGLDGMVYTVNGDTYTVKIPLPEGDTSLDTDGNVVFYPIEYTISATLITGGDNQCIDPATCTITLTPYLEPCTQN